MNDWDIKPETKYGGKSPNETPVNPYPETKKSIAYYKRKEAEEELKLTVINTVILTTMAVLTCLIIEIDFDKAMAFMIFTLFYFIINFAGSKIINRKYRKIYEKREI